MTNNQEGDYLPQTSFLRAERRSEDFWWTDTMGEALGGGGGEIEGNINEEYWCKGTIHEPNNLKLILIILTITPLTSSRRPRTRQELKIRPAPCLQEPAVTRCSWDPCGRQWVLTPYAPGCWWFRCKQRELDAVRGEGGGGKLLKKIKPKSILLAKI